MSHIASCTRLISFLISKNVSINLLEHEPCRSAEQSSAARASAGDRDSVGAKALLVKSRSAGFCMLALPAPARLASKTLRKVISDFRFASDAELAALTGGLQYGMVPPFAHPVFEAVGRLYIDQALVEAETVGFNAASLTTSVVMSCADYITVAGPKDILPFTEA